jgi:hypothetical protein
MAVPELAGFLGLGRCRATQAGQNIPRQASAGLAVGAAALVDVPVLVQGKKRLDLPDDLAAGAIGIEHLVEKSKEGAPDAENALSAVKALVGLRQQSGRQEPAEEPIQVKEVLLAQVGDAPAHRTEAGPPFGKEGCVHSTVLLLCHA